VSLAGGACAGKLLSLSYYSTAARQTNMPKVLDARFGAESKHNQGLASVAAAAAAAAAAGAVTAQAMALTTIRWSAPHSDSLGGADPGGIRSIIRAALPHEGQHGRLVGSSQHDIRWRVSGPAAPPPPPAAPAPPGRAHTAGELLHTELHTHPYSAAGRHRMLPG